MYHLQLNKQFDKHVLQLKTCNYLGLISLSRDLLIDIAVSNYVVTSVLYNRLAYISIKPCILLYNIGKYSRYTLSIMMTCSYFAVKQSQKWLVWYFIFHNREYKLLKIIYISFVYLLQHCILNCFYCVVTLSIVNAYNVQLARQMISVSNLAKVITIGTIIVCGIYNISSGEI